MQLPITCPASSNLPCEASRSLGKDVYNALIRNGWEEIRTGASSHRYLKNPNRGSLVTVPYTTRDLPKGTLNSILKQAGLSAGELHQML